MRVGVNSRDHKFFSPKEIEIMLDHDVPYSVAYQRVKIQKMDRNMAITKPLAYGKGRRKPENVMIPKRMLSVDELNWKE